MDVSAEVAQASVKVESKSKIKAARTRYRSTTKKHMINAFLNNSELTNYDLCGLLDAEGCLPPKKWREIIQPERSFQAAFKHPKTKALLATMISKVRRDLREKGLQ